MQRRHIILLQFFLSLCLVISTHSVQARHFKDTVHFRRPPAAMHEIVMTDSALNDLGVDSLLNKVESVHNTLTEIINKTGLGFDTRDIEDHDALVDSNISLADQNLKLYTNILDVKNLQMFEVMLASLHGQLEEWRQQLFAYDRQLLAMSSQWTAFRNDSLLKEIMADSVFSAEYAAEMQDIRDEQKMAKTLIAENQSRLKQWQVSISNQYFETIDLENRTRDLLRKTGVKALTKEYDYLWQMKSVSDSDDLKMRSLISESYRGQGKILSYYFRRNMADQVLMVLCGVLFYLWIFLNFRKRKQVTADVSDFKLITAMPLLPALVVLFNIAPFFDMHPPTAYIQINQFLMVISLTMLFLRKWERQMLYYWIAIAALYVAFSLTGILLVPTPDFRLLLAGLNVLALVFGIFWFRALRRHPFPYAWLVGIVSVLFMVLNLAALLTNVFGRLSISKIFSVTAIYSLSHIIGLTVFIQIILEAFHLQTLVNKQKGGLIGKLNFMKVEKQITTLLMLVAILVWCIVASISLNIYSIAFDAVSEFLTRPRRIGTTDFQIGNILSFCAIIYVSNLFQHAVGSLYGRTENNWDPEIKKNASRLAITRLMLIVMGFLVAVAASGLPMDKITIVLGALGVGIGLGLQTIVNNLVSGVILIFEQPFRIGDFIELGDKRGRVMDIGIRSSKIMMEEGAEIIMPNADLLSGRVINWTMRNENARIELAINVEPGHSFADAEKIIQQVVSNYEGVIKDQPAEILMTGITDKAMALKVLLWIDDVHKTQSLKSNVLRSIAAELEKQNIKLV